MLHSDPNQKKRPIVFQYHCEGETFHRINDVRDLGVWLDESLGFSDQVQSVVKAANKTLGFVIRNAKNFHQTVLTSLYNSLVRSRLEYACVVWDPLYGVHIGSLEAVQRRFLKFLFYKKHGHYPPQGYEHDRLLDEFGFLSLAQRRKIIGLGLLHGLVNGVVNCPYLLQCLNFNIPRTSGRRFVVFYTECPRTNVLKNSPMSRLCTLYNSLAEHCELHGLSSYTFRNKLTQLAASGCIL